MTERAPSHITRLSVAVEERTIYGCLYGCIYSAYVLILYVYLDNVVLYCIFIVLYL